MAVGTGRFHYSRNQAADLEQGTALENLAPALRGMGYEVKMVDFPSGLQGIVIDAGGLLDGADPRREGWVLGD